MDLREQLLLALDESGVPDDQFVYASKIAGEAGLAATHAEIEGAVDELSHSGSVDKWLDVDEVGFAIKARGRLEARRIRELGSARGPKHSTETNWAKWGAIGALLAIPTMIALWWFS